MSGNKLILRQEIIFNGRVTTSLSIRTNGENCQPPLLSPLPPSLSSYNGMTGKKVGRTGRVFINNHKLQARKRLFSNSTGILFYIFGKI